MEIGPGGAALTKELLLSGLTVTAVEKDTRFFEKLTAEQNELFGEAAARFKIVNADILKFDFENWIAEANSPNLGICGNIPYNISTPIVEASLRVLDKTRGAIFLVQKEFAVRMAAKHGSKDYGSLSVFVQLRSDCKIIGHVGRNSFRPVPKVDSAFVCLQPKANKLSDEFLKLTEKITRATFSQRRKMLRNSLRSVADQERFEACPLDLNRRPETLSPQEFVALAQYFTSSN